MFFESHGSVEEDADQEWIARDEGCAGRTGLPPAALFEALANPRRLFVLQYLLRVGSPVPEATVVDRLTAWETDTPVVDIATAERRRMAVSLRHTHLPKLVDARMVTVEDAEGEVLLTVGPNATAAEPHLALFADQ